MSYEAFLKSKLAVSLPSGFDVDESTLPPKLYPYQLDLVKWGCKRGKAALFTMTGTGKTFMQVSWADAVVKHSVGKVLMLAPLAVAKQTAHIEAPKININVNYCRDKSELTDGINITNYEMLHHFDPADFSGLVLDESGIIKDVSGKLRNQIIEFSKSIEYRLACSATPAPNDYTELGNHAELLGICSYREMLTTYFVNDIKCPEGWRLKRHAADKFYAWLATWCVFLCKPSDLNYSDEGFDLPQLNTYQHIVESGATEGALFAFEVKGLQERQAARRESMQRRIDRCVEIINSSEKPFLIWCDMNAESEGIVKAVPGAVQITGSDKPEHKEKTALDFAAGKIDVLVSKPSIIGRGLNLQACHNLAFLGLSDSFEAIFQATRRCYRHGQKHEVNRHIIISEAEGPVLQNVARKEADFMAMIGAMVEHTRKMSMENIRQLTSEKDEYEPGTCIIIPKWLKEGGY